MAARVAATAVAIIRAAGGLLVAAGRHWLDDNAARLAAALSYYALLSIAPLLMMAVAVAGAVFGEAAARGELVLRLGPVLGPGPAAAAEGFLTGVASGPATLGATATSLVILAFAASNVFTQLKGALNLVWRAERHGAATPDPSDALSWRLRSRRGAARAVRTRLAAALLVALTGVLLMASVVADAAMIVVRDRLGMAAVSPVPLPSGDSALSFAGLFVLIALVFKVLPDTRISWRDVWVGALFTTLLLVIGMKLLGVYVARGTLTSYYGAAGTVVAFLLWVYYCGMVFLYGAEFTHEFAGRYGSRRHAATARVAGPPGGIRSV
jgi:membrane protein